MPKVPDLDQDDNAHTHIITKTLKERIHDSEDEVHAPRNHGA
jgi:hypothetical protein